MMLRTLIVDDEPLARGRLRSLLESQPDVAIVGECADGRSTVAFLERKPDDLVLLDIQMPEMNGLEVVKSIHVDRLPAIVFVTAYDRYTLAAFEVHALDYLLKPVGEKRLRSALDEVRLRQRSKVQSDGLHSSVTTILDELESLREARQPFPIKADGQILFVAPEEIEWIKSAGNYSTLHAAGKATLVRETLGEMEKKLAGRRFVRISRSAIVNITKIKLMRAVLYGDYSIELRNGTKLILTRGHRRAFFDSLGRKS
jgi:two-component system LytT family response regulator